MKSMMPKLIGALGVLATTVTLATAAHAADALAGAEKAAVCAACHGADGKTPIDPSYPILAGQYRDYLAVALKEYRAGERKNAVMGGQAAALSNTDIENLAAYFSDLEGPLGIRK